MEKEKKRRGTGTNGERINGCKEGNLAPETNILVLSSRTGGRRKGEVE